MRIAIILAALLLSGCGDSTPETNAAEADEHAQQALQEIGDVKDELANIENTQNDIDANVQELGDVAADHDEKIQQAQSDIEAVKSRLNM